MNVKLAVSKHILIGIYQIYSYFILALLIDISDKNCNSIQIKFNLVELPYFIFIIFDFNFSKIIIF